MIKVKEVALITINNTIPNYGGILQNFAAAKVLMQKGYNVTTLIFENINSTMMEKIKALLYRLFRVVKYRDVFGLCEKRQAFNEFRKQHIPYEIVESTEKLSDRYDAFVVGSDQVWNVNWILQHPLKKEMFFLTFANDSQKISLAASFGIGIIPEDWKQFLKESLGSFAYLSVREEAGKKILDEIINKESKVIIDPTLMLDAGDWLKVARPPKRINYDRKYILTYFLGEKKQNITKKIVAHSKELGAVVYDLSDLEKHEALGPEEFLYLISKAALIETDSFHACVFSFLFSKPFQVYERSDGERNMNSRIEYFLHTFGLERKSADYEFYNDLQEKDYAFGYEELERKRKNFSDYIDDALK